MGQMQCCAETYKLADKIIIKEAKFIKLDPTNFLADMVILFLSILAFLLQNK